MAKENLLLQKEIEFAEWLPKNNVDAVSSYFTYLRNAKDALKVRNIDDFFKKAIENAIKEAITIDTIKSGKKRDVSNSRSALKKYWEFYLSNAGIIPTPKSKKK